MSFVKLASVGLGTKFVRCSRTACANFVASKSYSALSTPRVVASINQGIESSLLKHHRQGSCLIQQLKQLSQAAELSRESVAARVMSVLRNFERIDNNKLKEESHFIKELGLDSLDHVELLMAIEDEFGFEIPDQEADALTRPVDIVQHVCGKLQLQ